MNELSETLTEKQKKSAARLLVFNTEMNAVLTLKLRLFALRALKRARLDRVWRVAGPFITASATKAASTPTPMRVCLSEAAGEKGMSGAKRASRPSPTKQGSPSSSTPSKTRPRTGVEALLPPFFDG
jgi:hypothetical protein